MACAAEGCRVTAPYSRVYWSVMDDPKFDDVRGDLMVFGSWTLLLIVADMAYPAPAFVPRSIPEYAMSELVRVGLVESLSGDRFRIHGLAKEREMRSQSGRNAAAVRWQSEPNARRDETSKDKTSTPLPLTRGRRKNGTSPRQLGDNPRAQGTSPRQEREAGKRAPTQLHEILTAIQTKGKP